MTKPDARKVADDVPAVDGESPVARPCPICGKRSTAEMTPFCSKRCADVDLHRWLGGTYAVAAVESDEALPDDDPAAR